MTTVTKRARLLLALFILMSGVGFDQVTKQIAAQQLRGSPPLSFLGDKMLEVFSFSTSLNISLFFLLYLADSPRQITHSHPSNYLHSLAYNSGNYVNYTLAYMVFLLLSPIYTPILPKHFRTLLLN